MILPVTVNLKEIDEKGRDYQWIRPEVCLRCRESHLWGHGYVESWFDGYSRALLLRRYRCPLCGCIIKLKPKGYFKRFQQFRGHRTYFVRAGLVDTPDKWPSSSSTAAHISGHGDVLVKPEPLLAMVKEDWESFLVKTL